MIDTTKLLHDCTYLITFDTGGTDICQWLNDNPKHPEWACFEGDRGSWYAKEVVSVYGPISKETLPLVTTNDDILFEGRAIFDGEKYIAIEDFKPVTPHSQSPDPATIAPHDQGE